MPDMFFPAMMGILVGREGRVKMAVRRHRPCWELLVVGGGYRRSVPLG